MDLKDMITSAERALTVTRVFGEPYQQGGVTIVPVARIQGGAGGGEGGSAGDKGEGEGGGFGLMATPMGVFVIRGDQVVWRPAVDANRVVLSGLAVAVLALLTVRASIRARSLAAREAVRFSSRRTR